jgi:hypothetical protein
MNPQSALIELLERVAARHGPAVLITDEELQQWPIAAVKAMKSQRLIANASPACSAICPGCERDCVMPVHTLQTMTGVSASFIVCDKRSDISRVPVPAEKLLQWRCTIDFICRFIVTCLELRASDKPKAGSDLLELGIVSGDKRRQMLCPQTTDELILVVGLAKVPLTELIEYQNGVYSLDTAMIRQMADAATTADVRHTPSVARREVRKLDTMDMYDSWKKEYLALKKKYPAQSDAWCSNKIAKMTIAQGRNAETIRKQMKK